jgi:hypothetical protein
MTKNVGSVDRLLRLVAGLVILAAGYYYQSWWGLVGLVPLLTAVVSFCPLYPLIGISTCKKD